MLLLIEISILCYIDYYRYELTHIQLINLLLITNSLGITGNATFEVVIVLLLAKGSGEFATTSATSNE